MKCRACGRALKNPIYIAAGIGPVCSRKQKPDNSEPVKRIRIWFMSGPNATAEKRRTWLVRENSEPSYLVRIFPDDKGRTASCDCEIGKRPQRCKHIDAIVKADADRFGLKD